MEEYFCPNCQAVLNDQWGFDPDGGHGLVHNVVNYLWMKTHMTEITTRESLGTVINVEHY